MLKVSKIIMKKYGDDHSEYAKTLYNLSIYSI
jgi:hypothetical protein